MKYLALLTILTLALLVGCSEPPADVPLAQVEQDNTNNAANEPAKVVKTAQEVENIATQSTEVLDEASLIGAKSTSPASMTLEFTGYGVGKYHDGTFENFSTVVYEKDGQITSFATTIQAESIETGISGLNSHLRNEDFFEVQTYSQAVFSTVSIHESSITADLKIKDTTKRISFPATITDESISAEFLVNITEFNMGYTGVDERVRIAFTLGLE